MTNKTRRTEIQIETRTVTVIRTRGKQFSAYCEHCRANVPSFTANQTAELLQMTDSDVLQVGGRAEVSPCQLGTQRRPRLQQLTR